MIEDRAQIPGTALFIFVTLFSQISWSHSGARADEAAMYANQQCVAGLGASGDLSTFGAIRADTIVVGSASDDDNGLFLLQNGKPYFVEIDAAKLKTKKIAFFKPFSAGSFEVTTIASKNIQPLKIWYSKTEGAEKEIRLGTLGGDPNMDRSMMDRYQSLPQQALTSKSITAEQFENNLARQIHRQSALTSSKIKNELLDLESSDGIASILSVMVTSANLVGAGNSPVAVRAQSALSRVGDSSHDEKTQELLRLRKINRQKQSEALKSKYAAYKAALAFCASALTGEPKRAAELAGSSIGKTLDGKMSTLVSGNAITINRDTRK